MTSVPFATGIWASKGAFPMRGNCSSERRAQDCSQTEDMSRGKLGSVNHLSTQPSSPGYELIVVSANGVAWKQNQDVYTTVDLGAKLVTDAVNRA